ncbi:MAG: 4'-phosphopantetheinyl transferase superfamily protein [bacterium]|nr:4'-phosphopantetheinyl transferase superfamily protein [bacterium]
MSVEVDVFDIDLNEVRPEPASLSRKELDRASRFVNEADRNRYLTAHTWLRRVLGEATGTAQQDLVFEEGRNGKPHLAHPVGELTFSLARTNEHAVLAIGCGAAVGVDIESAEQVGLDPRTMERVLTPAEQRWLADQDDTQLSFLRLWVRKEALFKALGTGIGSDFAQTSLQGESPVGCGAHLVSDIDLGDGLLAAIATSPDCSTRVAGRPQQEVRQ